MSDNAIRMERMLNASPSKVWDALTIPGQMKEWYFDVKGFKLETGNEFTFTGRGPEGVAYLHLCKITEIIPGKKLSYTWRYEGYEGTSLLTFELLPEDNGTKLKLTHEGLNSFPDIPIFNRNNFVQGWTYFMQEGLPKYLDK